MDLISMAHCRIFVLVHSNRFIFTSYLQRVQQLNWTSQSTGSAVCESFFLFSGCLENKDPLRPQRPQNLKTKTPLQTFNKGHVLIIIK